MNRNNWIQSGFVLLTDTPRPDWSPDILPAMILSISGCITDTYPNTWAIPWVKTDEKELERIRERLELSVDSFRELREWVQSRMETNEFGWPNIFLSLGAAREFMRNFMPALPNIRIVGFSMSNADALDLVNDYSLPKEYGPTGVWTMTKRGSPPATGGCTLGFDILGYEVHGSFHSFICNCLEKDYRDKLGIRFNQYGLIETVEDAFRAAEFTNQDEAGAEPVAWFPFRLDEYEPLPR